MNTENPQNEVLRSVDGLHRRTIIQGAAWSIPVVAIAVTAPAAATSFSPTLNFAQPNYPTAACAPLTGVTVLATTDGTTPAANAPVTITLPPGFIWADDGTTTPRVVTTNASGVANVPSITPRAKNQVVTLSASNPTYGSSTATLTVNDAVTRVQTFDGPPPLPPLPPGVSAVDMVSGVTDAGAGYVGVLGSDGNAYRIHINAPTPTWSTSILAPGTATQIMMNNADAGTWVTDGTTIREFTGAIVLPALPGGAGVVDMVAGTTAAGTGYLAALGTDGKVYRVVLSGSPLSWTASTLPGTATKVVMNSSDAGTWVTDGTTIQEFTGASVLPPLPSGVTVVDMVSGVTDTGDGYVGVLGSDGNAYRIHINAPTPTWSTSILPAGTATKIIMNSEGAGTWVTDGSSIREFTGAITLPALPGGATVVDMVSGISAGTGYVAVRASDGNVYRANLSAPSPTWLASSLAPGTATQLAMNSKDAGTWVAGEGC